MTRVEHEKGRLEWKEREGKCLNFKVAICRFGLIENSKNQKDNNVSSIILFLCIALIFHSIFYFVKILTMLGLESD
jgi:hypothetical protein